MLAIVLRHCELSLYGFAAPSTPEWLITQFRTFGVQLFFVSSAFLMAEWLTRRAGDTRGYWQSRLDHVATPWLVWVGIYIAADLLRVFMRPAGSTGVFEGLLQVILYQPYWFVPILFFSLAILVPLRRYWSSWSLGLVLLSLSLIYGVNQYARWFPLSHTLALFGYLFPLWVGVRLFQTFQPVMVRVGRMSWWPILALLCLSFGLTLGEDLLMEHLGFPDSYNALQISNQFYSFVVLLVLLKSPFRLVPSFIDVRKDTYGIYLVHQVVAMLGRGAINFVVGTNAANETLFQQLPQLVQNPFARIGLWMLWTVVVYAVSLAITKVLRRTALAWTVGATAGAEGRRGISRIAGHLPLEARNGMRPTPAPRVMRAGASTPGS